ncbi:large neutral amino acids transporter small subunit 1 [Colletotrichum simmondsii]|uniref:Large neutral amino acids transporter small subunit 1 n=1 Tax=Colletotrichum simmondsii TaxID=703756 RepID=A0A135TKZ4_9PEZI|nr:large neutral amino acids transporter small subunit 1 [Colletotrichum simmondsii]
MADLRTDETSPFLQRPPASARSRDTSPAASAASASHKLTLFNGLAIVISLQIGSGIFSVPSQISQFVTAPGYGLLAWLFGGLLVWTGAASFIELGLRIPNNGGIQEYLRACYGEFAGFLFTWVWCTIIKPAANSMIATIFADYLTEAFVANQETLPPWVSKVVAASCIVTMTLVNCLGATAGAKAANLFLFLKMTALTIIIVLGCGVWAFGHGEGVPSSEYGWFGQAPEQREISLWEWLGDFGTATFGALWCYAGWEMVGFVLGDMKNPRRDLPLVINGSMIVVIIGFMLMNAALYVCLPMSVMQTSSTVAVEFANRILGTWAGLLFCVIVSISAMGALNSNVFATAKLVVVASQRGYFPAILANLHCSHEKDEAVCVDEYLSSTPRLVRGPIQGFLSWTQNRRWRRNVPLLPLMLNCALSIVYVAVGNFNGLVTFIGLAAYMIFFSSAVGLILLRRRDGRVPGAKAAEYSTWLINPVIFSAISGLLVVRGVISEPLQGGAILLVALLGSGFFSLRFGLRGFTYAETR